MGGDPRSWLDSNANGLDTAPRPPRGIAAALPATRGGATIARMTRFLITGANRGIGLELVRALHRRGESVIAACRQASPELDAVGVRVETGVDVAEEASIARLASTLDPRSLDCLVNNAGILRTDSLAKLELDAIREQMEVNAFAPLRLTAALADKLVDGAKVVFITSRMGSIEDNTSGGMYGYRMSKAALNMAGVSLARDLASRRIAVGILHPGMVATDMTRGFGHSPSMQRPDDTASMLIERIDELDMPKSGRFFHANGQQLPW